MNVDTKRQNPPLTPLPVVGPFERWNMNFLKLSKTKDGYLYLFPMVDSFTKWVEAFPMKTHEASEVAKIIFREIMLGLDVQEFWFLTEVEISCLL